VQLTDEFVARGGLLGFTLADLQQRLRAMEEDAGTRRKL